MKKWLKEMELICLMAAILFFIIVIGGYAGNILGEGIAYLVLKIIK